MAQIPRTRTTSLQPWERESLQSCYKQPEGRYAFAIYINVDQCSYWYGIMLVAVIEGFLKAAKLGSVGLITRYIKNPTEEKF